MLHLSVHRCPQGSHPSVNGLRGRRKDPGRVESTRPGLVPICGSDGLVEVKSSSLSDHDIRLTLDTQGEQLQAQTNVQLVSSIFARVGTSSTFGRLDPEARGW